MEIRNLISKGEMSKGKKIWLALSPKLFCSGRESSKKKPGSTFNFAWNCSQLDVLVIIYKSCFSRHCRKQSQAFCHHLTRTCFPPASNLFLTSFGAIPSSASNVHISATVYY